MKAFEFDRFVINNYERFSRSFISIRAKDLRKSLREEYDEGRFWPDALLSLNPHYEQGPSCDDLANSGELDPATARIFRFGDNPLFLHRHQAQAVAKARSGKSFVVTTGTGSGKSLCFFVPIVDAIVRAKRMGEKPATRAIIIYPMNALANSQIKEIQKFIDSADIDSILKPVVGRYTGQDDQTERNRMASTPPDILLTNFMMAELLLTRHDENDRRLIENAQGLQFIVLDELHTYRGRQGADVAVLVRRLKDRCTNRKPPVCIGTSATMASEGDEDRRAQEVADVASRLFGADIGPDAVIDESLRRATDDTLSADMVMPNLGDTLRKGFPKRLLDADLATHPLAVWVELALGLDDRRSLKRRKPVPFNEAVNRLARESGVEAEACEIALEEFLTLASLPEDKRGGTGQQAFLAFKLHRFVSGAGELYTTLKAPVRRIFTEGQLEDPYDSGTRLYPTRFCRQCGQEFHVVLKTSDAQGSLFIPRNIDETPFDDENTLDEAGYLTPIGLGDGDYRFNGSLESLPEGWVEIRGGQLRLKANRRNQLPSGECVGADGRPAGDGLKFWFIKGRFRFCPCCLDEPTPAMRERSKLGGLTSEGRSSATTLFVSSALEWFGSPSAGVPELKRKLLAFTDNRQDAALQAGHFNDFKFVSLLRGGILRAVEDAGPDGLGEDEWGRSVQKALCFDPDNANRGMRPYWMDKPDARADVTEAARTLAKVLAYRVWTDLRRGWRYTNPNLRTLKLIDIDYLALDEIAADRDALMTVLPDLGTQSFADRKRALRVFLDALLEGQAIDTEALDPTVFDTIAQRSRNYLCAPWALDDKEIRGRTMLVVTGFARNSSDPREESTLLRGGVQSRIARSLNRDKMIGRKLCRDDYHDFMNRLLAFLEQEGLVRLVHSEGDVQGWRLSPSIVRLVPGTALKTGEASGNPYFHDLYSRLAGELKGKQSVFVTMEGREHTAQVDQKQREWREWRFRFEDDDRKRIEEAKSEFKTKGEGTRFLPALFCSPTMELGVDISALNAVYLRNVPPTPANYAQRAGRAGRSGQAASIITYCASQSPHDQYFFSRREEMAAGIVRPPALDIANKELVTSHLHATWLSEARLALPSNIPEILDLEKDGYPLRQVYADAVADPALTARAEGPMMRILSAILASLNESRPVWLKEEAAYVAEIAEGAAEAFDRAFDRWRELYNSARSQLKEANERSESPGLSRVDRRKIKAAQMQASDQLAILEQGRASSSSDFYTYRYLATEGFLPGYNFPRLPLYAFIPGEGKGGAFLQRARFLGISEFGPRSLIYHEGRAFRVIKAKLPPDVRSEDGTDLATRDVFICANCGGAHEKEQERCHACNASLAGQHPIQRTLRIDNVEASPAERITANDEDRVRQGFDVQTVFSWPKRQGRVEVAEAIAQAQDEPLFTLQYANGAEISRINLGLRRRRDQTVTGFMIDPRTGYWARTADEESEHSDPDVERPVRIVPIVKDRKNALLLRIENPGRFEPETLVTLQHALMRGIASVFQIEEGEILGEPLPHRENRRAILFYEATEGGAGVLSRLIEEPQALQAVARKALELMHYEQIEEAVVANDPATLKEIEGDEQACVRGCYRCLLSYYNQTDHELIDRTCPEVLQMLIDISHCKLFPYKNTNIGGADSNSGWASTFQNSGLCLPDAKSLNIGGETFPFAWRAWYVAAKTGPISESVKEQAEEKGWTLFELPEDPVSGVPDHLARLLME